MGMSTGNLCHLVHKFALSQIPMIVKFRVLRILWHVDLLLGNGHGTTPIARAAES